MPLFAHWRLPPCEVYAWPQEGGPSATGRPPFPSSSSSTPSSIFCPYDDGLEQRLRVLHDHQRVHGDVQHEIDRCLVACIHPSLAHLHLPRHSVPHYDNLPDISAYALGILDPAMDADPELQQVLLLLRQCTPLRRRTKRAQREVQWREGSCFPMQTLVRCMQGTLLGLYPNCLKAVAFSARIAFYRFLRTLLVQPFQRLQAALNKIPYITKLSVMEHLCNTIYDYHPGICHTLNRSGQKIEHFCDSVSNICSIFRTELTTLFCAELPANGAPPTSAEMESILFRILPRLERLSHSFYERSTRAYRGIIIGAARPVRSLDIVRRLLPTSAPTPLAGLFDRIHAAAHPSVFDLVHASSIPLTAQRELAWHLTQLLQVHPLPACIAARQHAALHRRYGDSVRTRQCRMLHVCVQCVVRRGTTAGIRLRHDCITNELTCMTCGPGTVLAIDMVGRLAHIAGEYLLLSSCCGAFIFYKGAGCEFATACGEQCATGRQLFRKRERTSQQHAASGSPPPTCLVCTARAGIAQTFSLLEPRTRQMTTYAVCAKHTVPAHILEHAFTRDDLHRYFALRAASASAAGGGGRHASSRSRRACA